MVQVVDDQEGATGEVEYVELIIKGTPIVDSDADGLDDGWENTHFGDLTKTATDDPDKDGYHNSREQVMGTNPAQVDAPFTLYPDLSVWNGSLSRLSWPGSTNFTYSVKTAPDAAGPFTTLSNAPSTFPVAEMFVAHTNLNHRFYRIEATPVQ